jgi:hypothetical protein
VVTKIGRFHPFYRPRRPKGRRGLKTLTVTKILPLNIKLLINEIRVIPRYPGNLHGRLTVITVFIVPRRHLFISRNIFLINTNKVILK